MEFGAWLSTCLVFASLLGSVNALESVGQDVRAHHYGSGERPDLFFLRKERKAFPFKNRGNLTFWG